EIRKQLSTHFAPLTVTGLYIVFGLLLLKSSMELGLIIPELASLIYDTRNIIIGYLHFTLLGFVSIFIIIQLQLSGILNPYKRIFKIGFGSFFIGFLWNELLLFYDGSSTWFLFPMLPAFR